MHPLRSIQCKRLTAAVWLSGLLVCTAGCGSKNELELAPVKGTITLDGEPLAGAELTFAPVGGGSPSMGETDASGRYELAFTRSRKGAMIGSHTVRITTAVEAENEQGQIVRSPERVPAKYNRNSELTREVASGKNTIDFELDSQGEIVQENRD